MRKIFKKLVFCLGICFLLVFIGQINPIFAQKNDVSTKNLHSNFLKKYENELKVYKRGNQSRVSRKFYGESQEEDFILEYSDYSPYKVKAMLKNASQDERDALKENAAINHYFSRSGLNSILLEKLNSDEKKELYYNTTNMLDEMTENDFQKIAKELKLSSKEVSTMTVGEKYCIFKSFEENSTEDWTKCKQDEINIGQQLEKTGGYDGIPDLKFSLQTRFLSNNFLKYMMQAKFDWELPASQLQGDKFIFTTPLGHWDIIYDKLYVYLENLNYTPNYEREISENMNGIIYTMRSKQDFQMPWTGEAWIQMRPLNANPDSRAMLGYAYSPYGAFGGLSVSIGAFGIDFSNTSLSKIKQEIFHF